MNHLELAKMCEVGVGPDRRLDQLIELTLPGVLSHPDTLRPGYKTDEWAYVISGVGHPIHEPGQGYVSGHYTASVDAALKLAEPFMIAAMSDIAAGGLTGCCLVADTSTSPVVEYWGVPTENGSHRQNTMARAICAAALRAKAATEKS